MDSDTEAVFDKLLKLLSEDVSPTSPDYIFRLAQFDLALTTTTNCFLENGPNDSDTDEYRGALKIEFDTFVLCLLHQITGNFSNVIRLDESILNDPTNFKVLTQPLDNVTRIEFITIILRIRSQALNLDLTSQENEERVPLRPGMFLCQHTITEVLDCFLNFFGISFTVYLVSDELIFIENEITLCNHFNIFLTKPSSEEDGFCAIVPRRRLHSDDLSYLTSLTNDISEYQTFQPYFNSFAKSKYNLNGGSNLLDSVGTTFYENLTKCHSIQGIINLLCPILINVEDKACIHPLDILETRLNEYRLDPRTHRQIVRLIRTNIEIQVRHAAERLNSEQIEDKYLEDEEFRDIKQCALRQITEANHFCEKEEKKIEEMKKQMTNVKTSQASLISVNATLEIEQIRQDIFKKRGYITWKEFLVNLSKIEFDIQGFLQFDLDLFTSQNPNLELTLKKMNEWVQIPTTEEFKVYVSQNKAQDLEDVMKYMRRWKSSTISQEEGSESQPLEIFGHHILLSHELERIRDREYPELRIISQCTLTLDTDLVIPGRNILLCADRVIIDKNIKIDTSGVNGIQFSQVEMNPPQNTVRSGIGIDGNPGQNGGSAGHVTVIGIQPIDGLKNLFIVANGGNGANGQNGGNGGIGFGGDMGKDGHVENPGMLQVWSSLKVVELGEEGKPGKPGGKGGRGGAGGIPGSCGEIHIRTGDQEDSYWNRKHGNFECLNGQKGNDGRPGAYGECGKGGKNGSDHGFATESFFWGDSWVEGEGKLELFHINGWLKRGYRIAVLKTKNEVHETYYNPTRDQEDSQNTTNTIDYSQNRLVEFIAPNQKISYSRNLQIVLNQPNHEENGIQDLAQNLEEILHLEVQLYNHINEGQEWDRLGHQMELTTRLRNLKLSQNKISKLESNVEKIRNKQSTNLKIVNESKYSLEHWRLLNKKFEEENRISLQTEEQVETYVALELPVNDDLELDGVTLDNTPELLLDQVAEPSVSAYTFLHQYSQRCDAIMKHLENHHDHKILEAFEECLQKAISYSVTQKSVHVPDCFFDTVEALARSDPGLQSKNRMNGYLFLEFVAKILPVDFQLSLEHEDNSTLINFMDKFFDSPSNSSVHLFSKVYELRTRKYKFSELKKLENFLIKFESPRPLVMKDVLEDIIEKHFVEHFVNSILNPDVPLLRRFGKGVKKVFTAATNLIPATRNYDNNDYEDGIDGQVEERQDEESEDNHEEDYEKFGIIEPGELSHASAEVRRENRAKSILSETELREISKVRIEITKELRSLGWKVYHSTYLDPRNLSQSDLMSEDMIIKFIYDVTSQNLSTMKTVIDELVNADVHHNVFHKSITRNNLPLYKYIISNTEFNLDDLNQMYELGVQVKRKFKNHELFNLFSNIYLEKFQKTTMQVIRNSRHFSKYSKQIETFEKCLESKYSTLTLKAKMETYNVISKSSEEDMESNLTKQVHEIGKILTTKFRSKFVDDFNSNQSVTTFIHMLEDMTTRKSLLQPFDFLAFVDILPKLVLHLEQLNFKFSDLKKVWHCLFEIHLSSSTESNLEEIFVQIHSKFQVTQISILNELSSKFDLDGKALATCDRILNEIQKTLEQNELLNYEEIFFHFNILLQRILSVLILYGNCKDIGQLAQRLENLVECCPTPENFLRDLSMALASFLQNQMECQNQIEIEIPTTPLTRSMLIVQNVKSLCEENTPKIETIKIIHSKFLTHYSLDSLYGLLSSENLSSSDNQKRLQALGETKKILLEYIKKGDPNLLNEVKTLRTALINSTRPNFNKFIYTQIQSEMNEQLDNVKNSVPTFQETVMKIFSLLENPQFITNRKGRFDFFKAVYDRLENPIFSKILTENLLNEIFQDFMNSFFEIPPQQPPATRDSNILTILSHQMCQYLDTLCTIPNSQIDEYQSTWNSPRPELYTKFTQNCECLTQALAKELWNYPEDLQHFCRVLEKYYLTLSGIKLDHPGLKAIQVFFQNILNNFISSDESFQCLGQVTPEITLSLFESQILRIKSIIAIKQKNLNLECLDENNIWECLRDEASKSPNWKYISPTSPVIQNNKFKTRIASAILNPSCTEIQRMFLLRVMTYLPANWKSELQESLLNRIRNLISVKKSVSPDDWLIELKPHVLNLISKSEELLLKQLDNLIPDKNKIAQSKRSKLVDLLVQNKCSNWKRVIRDFVQDEICTEYFPNLELRYEMDALNYFIRQELGDEKGDEQYFQILTYICKLLKGVELLPGQSPTMNMKKFFKYSQHILCVDVGDILKSKFIENWVEDVLTRRLLLTVNEIIHDFPKPNVEECVDNLKIALVQVPEKKIREQFLIIFGDSLLRHQKQSFFENTDTKCVLKSIQGINSCLNQTKLSAWTPEFLTSLSRVEFQDWKACFRKAELLEMGLTLDCASVVINIESKVSNSQLTDNFLKHFKTYFSFKENVTLLNQILIKIESGEWFLNSDTPKLFQCQGQEMTENNLLQSFENAANDKIGSHIEGKDLIDELIKDPMNEHLIPVLADSLLKTLEAVKRNLNGDHIFERTINPTKKLQEWDKYAIVKWTHRLKNKVRDLSHQDGFKQLMHGQAEVLSVICQAVFLHSSYYPWDTQILSVMLYLDSTLQNGGETGRLGQIFTGEGKTLITAMVSIFWALPGANVNIMTSTSILAIENELEVGELFKMFEISVGNNCDKLCEEGGDPERQKRNMNQVIYGDLHSFQADILQTENLGKNLLQGREAHYVFVDEADNMLLDKAAHTLYISHPVMELRHLRPVFLKIWEIVNKHNSKSSADAEAQKIFHNTVQAARFEIQKMEEIIPKHLRTFVNNRLSTWVRNAYHAKALNENDPYIVSDSESGKVIIIDKDTGMQQASTQLSFGIQQFLQLKHRDKLSCENLKGIFISTYSYFQRYKGRLYGITGTLGSEKSKDLLAKIYKVDFFCMERHKFRHCVQDEARVARTEEEWLQALKEVAEVVARSGRPVLIIGKNIKDVRKISSYIRGEAPYLESMLYESSTDKTFLEFIRNHEIPPGLVIVGTNLAGRGTDLKISEDALNSGGLHVILSYLPSNSRIEDQGFGRTGRKGEPGSTQFVLFSDDSEYGIIQLLALREERENQRLEEFLHNQLPKIEIEEALFRKFQIYTKEVEKDKNLLQQRKNLREIYMQHVRTRWALWLDSKHEVIKIWKVLGKDRILLKFKEFEDETSALIKENKLAQFPSQLVKIAKAHEENGKFGEAILCLSDAIEIDPNFAEIPIYYKAYCILKQKPNGLQERKEAVRLLKVAQALIMRTITDYSMLPNMLDQVNAGQEGCEYSRNFANQIAGFGELLLKHSKCIDAALGVPVNSDLFRTVTGVSTAGEAQELFQVIQGKYILKKNRVSKKVKIDGDKIFVTSKTDPAKFDEFQVPFVFRYIATDIREAIKSSLDARKPSRDFNCSELTSQIISKEDLWDKLLKIGALECDGIESTESYTISFSESKMNRVTFPHAIQHLKFPMALILMDNNRSTYEGSTVLHPFDLTLEQENIIESELIFRDILQVSKKLKAKVRPRFIQDLSEGINTHVLEKFSYFLTPLLISKAEGFLSPEDIPYLPSSDNTDSQRQQLLEILIEHGIVKEFSVNISLRRDFESIEKKMKELDKSIEDSNPGFTAVFQRYHRLLNPDDKNAQKNYELELKIYLKSIKEVIKNSVGSLRSVGKIRANVNQLEASYCTSRYPHEIIEFVQCDYNRVLTFCKATDWWRSGAFIVTLLGIGQLALGVKLMFVAPSVGMALISEGLGDVYYGWSAGYTSDNFSLSDYATQKSISVAASAITCGIDFTGGLSLTRIGMEAGEEFVKRTILKRVTSRIGGQVFGVLFHECLNWGREQVFKKFKGTFLSTIPNVPGYQRQIGILQVRMENIFVVAHDRLQAEKIIQDTMAFLWNEENSVFWISLNNAAARIAPQIIGRVTSSIANAYATVGNTFVNCFSLLMTYITFGQTMVGMIIELAQLAENALGRLNHYLQCKIDFLQRQEQHGVNFGPLAQTEASSRQSIISTNVRYIDEQLCDRILSTLQGKLVEPALVATAQLGLEYSLEKACTDKRINSLKKLEENQGLFTAEMEEHPIASTSTSVISKNKANAEVREAHREHVEGGKTFQDKYGDSHTDL